MDIKATVPQLPLALTMEHFEKGQCPNPPMTSSCVLKIVSTDPNSPSEKEIRMSQSITSDLVYITTKGFIKPAQTPTNGSRFEASELAQALGEEVRT